MPTDLGRRFDPSFSSSPPHMSPEDRDIWARYQVVLSRKATDLYFDVGLGKGETPPPGTSDSFARMWRRLTQKRADIIARVDNEVWIIELRHAATANAIGRLLTYKQLYLDDPVLGKNVKLVLVTNARDTDVERIARATNIEYVVI